MVNYNPQSDPKHDEKTFHLLENILLNRREQRAYLNQQTASFAESLNAGWPNWASRAWSNIRRAGGGGHCKSRLRIGA
jgi:hypothetical protein